jgi:hypothetical protein
MKDRLPEIRALFNKVTGWLFKHSPKTVYTDEEHNTELDGSALVVDDEWMVTQEENSAGIFITIHRLKYHRGCYYKKNGDPGDPDETEWVEVATFDMQPLGADNIIHIVRKLVELIQKKELDNAFEALSEQD